MTRIDFDAWDRLAASARANGWEAKAADRVGFDGASEEWKRALGGRFDLYEFSRALREWAEAKGRREAGGEVG